ncbi:anthranilate phosphoribosyltransferase [Clydaea vesicula]|uniref:Anthranilate phosphoribosyltransferase n=1 Tax=Clydaea vesicula TaxID=447962 RepID=A0AAD5U4M0_9FUNG|nr:anthranilate phosphoribosyltransferase [Clydaea vesicula]
MTVELMKTGLKKLTTDSKNFTAEDAACLTTIIMNGNATPAQVASFLTALKLTGKETEPNFVAAAKSVNEILVAASMRNASVHIPYVGPSGMIDGQMVVDIVGTGGDGQDTFNVSTASSLVAAGAGIKVAKHGNRASSSQCGSADVLEYLGCNLNSVEPPHVLQQLKYNNFCFLFAQKFHPSMKNVALPRKELGPLSNPAVPKRMVVGVHSKEIGLMMAESLKLSGIERGLVVCGDEGLDEISPEGVTNTWSFDSSSNDIKFKKIYPEADFGLKSHPLSTCKGGNVKFNAEIMLKLLRNELPPGSPLLNFVLINSAALIFTAGKAETFKEGVELARRSLADLKAFEAFDGFLKATNE